MPQKIPHRLRHGFIIIWTMKASVPTAIATLQKKAFGESYQSFLVDVIIFFFFLIILIQFHFPPLIIFVRQHPFPWKAIAPEGKNTNNARGCYPQYQGIRNGS